MEKICKENKKYLITNIHQTSRDREGSRIHLELLVMAYCENNGLIYLGTECSKPREMPFDRDAYCKIAKLLKIPENIKSQYADDIIKQGETIFLDAASDCLKYNLEGYPDINELLTSTVREKWIQRWWYDKKQNNEAISIVLHIRRGDIWPETHPNRYIYNSYYMDILKSIISKISDNYKITICSDTRLDKYSEYWKEKGFPSLTTETFDIFTNSFSKDKIQFKINENTDITLKRMIESDIFIMSRSSFSYIAAIFNKGIVIYHPFWVGKLNGWLNSKDDDFENQLETRLVDLKK